MYSNLGYNKQLRTLKKTHKTKEIKIYQFTKNKLKLSEWHNG